MKTKCNSSPIFLNNSKSLSVKFNTTIASSDPLILFSALNFSID